MKAPLLLLLFLAGCTTTVVEIQPPGPDAGDAGDAGAQAAPDGALIDAAPPGPDAGAHDSAPAVDGGTGYLGDPCDPNLPATCGPQLQCFPMHSPLASQDMFRRCTFYCDGIAAEIAKCEQTLGGTCQGYASTATATICVPK